MRFLHPVNCAKKVSMVKMEDRARNARQALFRNTLGKEAALSAPSDLTPRKEQRNAKTAKLDTTVQTQAA